MNLKEMSAEEAFKNYGKVEEKKNRLTLNNMVRVVRELETRFSSFWGRVGYIGDDGNSEIFQKNLDAFMAKENVDDLEVLLYIVKCIACQSFTSDSYKRTACHVVKRFYDSDNCLDSNTAMGILAYLDSSHENYARLERASGSMVYELILEGVTDEDMQSQKFHFSMIYLFSMLDSSPRSNTYKDIINILKERGFKFARQFSRGDSNGLTSDSSTYVGNRIDILNLILPYDRMPTVAAIAACYTDKELLESVNNSKCLLSFFSRGSSEELTAMRSRVDICTKVDSNSDPLIFKTLEKIESGWFTTIPKLSVDPLNTVNSMGQSVLEVFMDLLERQRWDNVSPRDSVWSAINSWVPKISVLEKMISPVTNKPLSEHGLMKKPWFSSKIKANSKLLDDNTSAESATLNFRRFKNLEFIA